MKTSVVFQIVLVTCWVGVGGVPAVLAGDLEPPGPPGPTMKPLSDVEARTPVRNDTSGSSPVVIDQRGSYYLAEDIFATPGNHGIEITVSHVTLDLNGYSVIGSTEIATKSGIYADPESDLVNITVRDGTVRTFSDDGVDLGGVWYAVVEQVRSLDNGQDGSGDGVAVGRHGRVIDSYAVNNGSMGIHASSYVVMTRVVVKDNSGAGIGCAADAACQVTDSVVSNNSGGGVFINQGLVQGCIAFANTGDDITATNSLIRGNQAGSINNTIGSLLVENHIP